MAWTGTEKLKWGDTPQDFVSEAVEDKLGNDWWKDPSSVPVSRKREVLSLLLKDKQLKEEVDEAYREAWGRPANKAEYRNLIRTGLLLGKKAPRKRKRGR